MSRRSAIKGSGPRGSGCGAGDLPAVLYTFCADPSRFFFLSFFFCSLSRSGFFVASLSAFRAAAVLLVHGSSCNNSKERNEKMLADLEKYIDKLERAGAIAVKD